MKNSLKFILVSGMTVMLSACLMSEEDRIKDHRMKCEMYGFLPGTAQFARCVQKREGRHLDSVYENRKLSDEEERTRLMRERMEEKRYHRHHRDRYDRYPAGYREERTTIRFEGKGERRAKKEAVRQYEAAAAASRHHGDAARRAQEESIRRENDAKRHMEAAKRQQQEAEKQRQLQEENKRRQEEAKRREAAKAAEAGIGQQVVVPEETTPAGIGAQVPVTQPAPADAVNPAGAGTKAP